MKGTDVPAACLFGAGGSAVGDRRRPPRRMSLHLVLIRRAGDALALWELATLWNLTGDGIGLHLPRPLEPGTLLQVQFRHALVPDRVAKVIHASPNDTGWLVGCEITLPFSETEVEALQL